MARCWHVHEVQMMRMWVRRRGDTKLGLIDFDLLARMKNAPLGLQDMNWHYQVGGPHPTTHSLWRHLTWQVLDRRCQLNALAAPSPVGPASMLTQWRCGGCSVPFTWNTENMST